MGDLKTFFDKAVYPDTSDTAGASVTSRGSDPNANGNPGPGAFDPFWDKPIVPTPSGAESANSVSGLPSLPNRFEPTEGKVDPPSLERRSPGTIDKR